MILANNFITSMLEASQLPLGSARQSLKPGRAFPVLLESKPFDCTLKGPTKPDVGFSETYICMRFPVFAAIKNFLVAGS